MKRYFILLFFLAVANARAQTALENFFQAQTNLQTWSADFTQTRILRTLKQPLVTEGRIWFSAPNQFRWELGRPPQTIAIRQSEQMLLVYPILKRAEKYPLAGGKSDAWKEMLSVLEAGFPRSERELRENFKIMSERSRENRLELSLEPRAAAAKRFVKAIALVLDQATHTLVSSELKLRDGSSLRNDFTNSVVNPNLDRLLFEPEIPADYKVSDFAK